VLMFQSQLYSEMPRAALFLIVFFIVFILIGLIAWTVRRFNASRASVARNRQPRRLAVIESVIVDKSRHLMLIRRDNIEHLLMIGGPTDLVIELNIVRMTGAREVATPGIVESAPRPKIAPPQTGRQLMSEPTSRSNPDSDSITAHETEISAQHAFSPKLNSSAEPKRLVEPPLRVPAPEAARPLQPAVEPAMRPDRAILGSDPWLPSELTTRSPPAADSLTAMALRARLAPSPDLDTSAKPERPNERPTAREPADSNLEDMARQLEDALRRTPAAEVSPTRADPLVAAPKAADAVHPVLRESMSAKLEKTSEQPTVESESKTDSKKIDFDTFEREFADLLRRP
jgi:flagellar protein FliO/FliZ